MNGKQIEIEFKKKKSKEKKTLKKEDQIERDFQDKRSNRSQA